jgi:hypothetical protein
MPDPKQMAGIPRPDGQMAAGSVSVRLIRGDLSNNITGHPVELHVGDKVQTLNTDAAGRVEFVGLAPGSTVKAVAVVDGERLESQEFPVQPQGGVRLMLVATDKEKERQKAEEANLPPIDGLVVIGGDSRIVLEAGEESLSVYYILEIMNTARAPVNPKQPFLFDTPRPRPVPASSRDRRRWHRLPATTFASQARSRRVRRWWRSGQKYRCQTVPSASRRCFLQRSNRW